jgi:hypothetical protein
LADRLLDGVDTTEDVLTETLDGGLLRILRFAAAGGDSNALQKPIDDSVMALFASLFPADDIQGQQATAVLPRTVYTPSPIRYLTP